ncbi:NAD(P)/FAD-dependent oxidoreductase [Streptomyces sp. GQFP]|uniref:NAD(P)/FAD-dependent oxidoreductase n=1 Tax=Streptomyces sp. GQFP TaxID=2907545 RepID=UPI001F448B9A|nr:FAD-dependent oxidoreductase [Streptomyces sp. GQFP]UIX35270.1 FAD-dependent oxidoreductase [Streptomyces sp. GQFP]
MLIVGASVAGVRTLQALRREGFDSPITMIGEERHHPYDKPPLSKQMLQAGADRPVPLVAAEKFAALDVDLRLNTRATALDAQRRLVTTAAGDHLEFTHLVIATGVIPRTLPGIETPAGVYTIRSADDAAALRAELDHARRVVVVGAGFIGAEFASSAAARGADVVVVETQTTPMAHLLGAEVGAQLARLHAANGVTLHSGVQVTGLLGTPRVTGVALADGRVLLADLVVVGIGTVPATDWLRSSGLPVSNGVDCDERLRVPGTQGIYAAGDVACRFHPRYGLPLRIEHWTNANEHGEIVAADVVGGPPPRQRLPYIWSDQYGRRIQIVGRPGAGEVAAVHGGIDEERFVAVYADQAGVAVGALVVDDPRTLMKCRKAIDAGLDVTGLDLDGRGLERRVER